MQQFYNDESYFDLLETKYNSKFHIGLELDYQYGKIIILGKVKGRQGYFFVRFLGKECVGIICHGNLLNGKYSCPNDPTVYGVGKRGFGKHTAFIGRKQTKVYDVWFSMLRRCYCPTALKLSPQYENTKVCEEWLDFNVFADWFEETYIDGYHLDKDLRKLNDGSKLYSPQTCTWLPININSFMTNVKNTNIYDGMIGVVKHSDNKYSMCIKDFLRNKSIRMNGFKTPEDANLAYIEARKQQAENVKQYMRDLGHWSEDIICLIK